MAKTGKQRKNQKQKRHANGAVKGKGKKRVFQNHDNQPVERTDRKIDKLFKIMEEENPLSRIIVIKSRNDTAAASLHNACATAKILMNITKYGGGYALEIDGEVFAKDQFPNMSTAQIKLSEIVINKLKEICFVLEKKPMNRDNYIKITSLNDLPLFDEGESIEYKPVEDVSENKTILDQFQSNPGYQMLLKMGWSGKGLGSSEQGIVNPVELKDQDILSGDTKMDHVAEMLKNYHKSNCTRPLMFYLILEKSERGYIHNLSLKCGLRSKSINIDDNRVLTVSKKLDTKGIIEVLIKNGGEDPYYKLHIPTKFQHLFENY